MNRRNAAVLLFFFLLFAAGVALFLVAASGPGDDDAPPADAAPSADAPRPAERAASRRGVEPAPGRERGAAATDDAATAETPATTAADAPAPQGPAPEVKILVLDETGAPAAAAAVKVWGHAEGVRNKTATGTTDAEGRVTVALRVWGGFVHAVLGDRAGVSEVDDSRETVVRLVPTIEIPGRVVDEGGAGIAGAAVALEWWIRDVALEGDHWSQRRLVTQSNDAGDFVFTSVPREPALNDSFAATATARGYASGETGVPLDSPRDVVIVLAPAARVTGRCVDEAGRPVPGVSVDLADGDSDTAVSAPDGRFAVDDVPREGAVLRFLPAAHAPCELGPLTITAPEHDVGDVVLVKGGKIVGTFLDLDGKPVAGGNVELHHGNTHWRVRSFTSGDDGKFVFEHVADTVHRITGSAPRGAGESWSATRTAELKDVRPDGTDVRLVLTGALSLRVRFLDAADRSPVTVREADLDAEPLEPELGAAGWGWAGGEIQSVRIEVEKAGAFKITLTIPGYEPAVVDRVEILPDREVTIDVLFRKRPE